MDINIYYSGTINSSSMSLLYMGLESFTPTDVSSTGIPGESSRPLNLKVFIPGVLILANGAED